MERTRPLSERAYLTLLSQAIAERVEGLVVLRECDGTRHGVWVEGSYVVGVHVAGEFDPLLERLRQRGALDAHSHARCVRRLAQLSERAGAVACAHFGVARREVREALGSQLTERFRTLSAIAQSSGYDARFEPRAVPVGELAMRMPLGSLLRRSERSTASAHGADARRALRRLAAALHPDRHPELSAEQRARLGRELARATAAYHGLC